TAAAIIVTLGMAGLDSVVCYQSRVGPLEWIGPATDAEIIRAGRDGVAVVVAPVAFVSEHSETLVELDIEYRHLAERSGVPGYWRVPTVGDDPSFIAGLARLVRDLAATQVAVSSGTGNRVCPRNYRRCAMGMGTAEMRA
ncbi:MAG: ferrochelatase, partial [Alphaproteobacteria bacterium]|nr:ferrochelatase [Alphaproteobacteria bacterium]